MRGDEGYSHMELVANIGCFSLPL